MIWSRNQAGSRLALTGPLVVAVLAATAVPVELGRTAAPIEWTIHFSDFWENVIGFVPVGMAFAGLGFIRALAFSTAMSVVAETSQIWMVNRSPQPADVAANVLGAIIGTLVCMYFGFCVPPLPLNRKVGFVATASAVFLFSWMW